MGEYYWKRTKTSIIWLFVSAFKFFKNELEALEISCYLSLTFPFLSLSLLSRPFSFSLASFLFFLSLCILLSISAAPFSYSAATVHWSQKSALWIFQVKQFGIQFLNNFPTNKCLVKYVFHWFLWNFIVFPFIAHYHINNKQLTAIKKQKTGVTFDSPCLFGFLQETIMLTSLRVSSEQCQGFPKYFNTIAVSFCKHRHIVLF